MRIAVMGLGYLGTTQAACLAHLGHEVLGVDTDHERVAALEEGRLPFHEPDLRRLLADGLSSGHLKHTTSYADAAAFADIHLVCVGTPQGVAGHADLAAVHDAIGRLAPLLVRPSVVIGRSTVPVGTAANLADRLRSDSTADVELGWCPEFLREGQAVADSLAPDRIVLGVNGYETRAEAATRAMFSETLSAGTRLLVTDYATAELSKSTANTFLAMKISYINAVAEMCDAAGADVTTLADALGLDRRIGRAFLDAGLGFGGGCLPKDIRALSARSAEVGADNLVNLIEVIDTINLDRRRHVIELTRELCGTLAETRVAVLGAAFKPGSDDVRDSPALDVAAGLHSQGADVRVYDPVANAAASRVARGLDFVAGVREACDDAHIVLVLTDWEQFRSLRPEDLSALVATRIVIDGRNCLVPSEWRSAGWTYRGLGRR